MTKQIFFVHNDENKIMMLTKIKSTNRSFSSIFLFLLYKYDVNIYQFFQTSERNHNKGHPIFIIHSSFTNSLCVTSVKSFSMVFVSSPFKNPVSCHVISKLSITALFHAYYHVHTII